MNRKPRAPALPEYDTLLQSISGIAEGLQSLNRQAVQAYTPVVESILRSRNRDTNHIDLTLEGLLGFCGYAWSSARHYVEGSDDGLTDTNPYLGPFDAEHRREYGEALMSGIDDEFIRRFPRGSPIGGDVFAGSLRRDRGRQRVKRGRPTRSVFISSKHVANE